MAAKAAQAFYGHLAAGRFDDYAKGMAGVDGLPPAYRSQVLDAARQLMAVQLTAHGGIDSVGVAGESIEESGGRAVALLTLCFHDGIREEVAVPMVEVDGEWKMR